MRRLRIWNARRRMEWGDDVAYLIGSSKIYLFVQSEENTTSITASEHSVEDGEDLTDHVKPDPESISITGKLVGSGYKNRVKTIKSWQKSGEVVRYSGGVILRKCLIHNFQATHTSDTYGGCDITLDLKSVRIATPAYVVTPTTTTETAETVNAGVQSVEVNNSEDYYHTVKSGDTVYALVNGPYKKYGKTCAEIMEMNPSAFSTYGDFTTLQVGARLKMG